MANLCRIEKDGVRSTLIASLMLLLTAVVFAVNARAPGSVSLRTMHLRETEISGVERRAPRPTSEMAMRIRRKAVKPYVHASNAKA